MYREGGVSADLIRHAEEWAGAKNGVWDRAAEERFARGFERYLADGQAPTPGLARVFSRFKQWMADVYGSITGSPIDVDLAPEMRQVFDNLLGRGAEAAEPPGTIRQEMARAVSEPSAKAGGSFAVRAYVKGLTTDQMNSETRRMKALLRSGQLHPRQVPSARHYLWTLQQEGMGRLLRERGY